MPKYAMLFNVGNNANVGNMLERDILPLLGGRLPPGWRVTRRAAPRGRLRPDCVLEVKGPGGERASLIVEFKSRLEPKDVSAVAYQLKAYVEAFGKGAVPLVVAPFISPSVRERLKEAGLPFADPTGNIRLFSSRPALFVETQGADRNPSRTERPARSLKGAKAGRIVRALCDASPPFAVRKLAAQSGVSAGYVSRLLAFLEQEDLIQRESRGPVTAVRWRRLIQRWARDYSFLGSNRVVSFLEPRDIAELPARLVSSGVRAVVTGSAAAATVAPVAPTRLLAVFVESPEAVAERLDLRAAESGANVLLAEPYDPVVFDRVRERDGVSYAALSQVAIDLLTGPGRGPSEAEALLEWMQAHESSWRG